MLLVLVIMQALLEVQGALLDLLERIQDIFLTNIDGSLQDVLIRLIVLVCCLHQRSNVKLSFSLTDDIIFEAFTTGLSAVNPISSSV